MRHINKNDIHKEAVKLLRESKNNMKKTANRLAACNVDKQIDSILAQVKADCWTLEDCVIIKGCAQRMIIEFCEAEINNEQR